MTKFPFSYFHNRKYIQPVLIFTYGEHKLTVLGLGSSIICINDFAPGENQIGQENSAACIYTGAKEQLEGKISAILV